ncbi:hypothetical protein RB595_010114 [Gaeumannomyces hyphopodioides]
MDNIEVRSIHLENSRFHQSTNVTQIIAKMSMFRSKKLDLGCTIKTRVVRDHTKRKVFEQFEPERQALRYIIRNTTLPPRMRAEAQLQLTQMHAYTRPTQIRNRCILGGKTRGVLRDFKLTRVRRATLSYCGNTGGCGRFRVAPGANMLFSCSDSSTSGYRPWQDIFQVSRRPVGSGERIVGIGLVVKDAKNAGILAPGWGLGSWALESCLAAGG